MTKTLMKKQLMELFSFFWQDKKKNQNRTGIRFVLFFVALYRSALWNDFYYFIYCCRYAL